MFPGGIAPGNEQGRSVSPLTTSLQASVEAQALAKSKLNELYGYYRMTHISPPKYVTYQSSQDSLKDIDGVSEADQVYPWTCDLWCPQIAGVMAGDMNVRGWGYRKKDAECDAACKAFVRLALLIRDKDVDKLSLVQNLLDKLQYPQGPPSAHSATPALPNLAALSHAPRPSTASSAYAHLGLPSDYSTSIHAANPQHSSASVCGASSVASCLVHPAPASLQQHSSMSAGGASSVASGGSALQGVPPYQGAGMQGVRQHGAALQSLLAAAALPANYATTHVQTSTVSPSAPMTPAQPSEQYTDASFSSPVHTDYRYLSMVSNTSGAPPAVSSRGVLQGMSSTWLEPTDSRPGLGWTISPEGSVQGEQPATMGARALEKLLQQLQLAGTCGSGEKIAEDPLQQLQRAETHSKVEAGAADMCTAQGQVGFPTVAVPTAQGQIAASINTYQGGTTERTAHSLLINNQMGPAPFDELGMLTKVWEALSEKLEGQLQAHAQLVRQHQELQELHAEMQKRQEALELEVRVLKQQNAVMCNELLVMEQQSAELGRAKQKLSDRQGSEASRPASGGDTVSPRYLSVARQ